MASLRSREGIAARALEFTIFCAARTGEVTGAKWDEIDFSKGLWTIPPERMKAGKEHRIPLPPTAIRLLQSLPQEDGNSFVFAGLRRGTGISNMAMAAVLKRMSFGHVTVHGFRSTFRDWAAESTSYPNHVVEMALAHTIMNKAEAAYRRGDLFEKRRELMLVWGAYCEKGHSQLPLI